MKLFGKDPSADCVDYVVVPRNDGDIVFTVKPVYDFSEFDNLCPLPKAGTVHERGKGQRADTDNPRFKEKIAYYSMRKFAWIILESLRDTEGLQWETVQPDDPDTWMNYQKELVDAKFTDKEIAKIIETVLQVNSLDEAKLKEARDRFLAGRTTQQESSSQKEEQETTSSGEPAKD